MSHNYCENCFPKYNKESNGFICKNCPKYCFAHECWLDARYDENGKLKEYYCEFCESERENIGGKQIHNIIIPDIPNLEGLQLVKKLIKIRDAISHDGVNFNLLEQASILMELDLLLKTINEKFVISHFDIKKNTTPIPESILKMIEKMEKDNII